MGRRATDGDRHAGRGRRGRAIAVASVLILAAAVWLLRSEPQERGGQGDNLDGFGDLPSLIVRAGEFSAPASAPPSLPRDHGPHADQFIEYWRLAGIVSGDDGRDYGFEFQIHRIALARTPVERESALGTRDLHAARLQIVAAGGRGYSSDRVARAALGLAGAEDTPARIWIGDWRLAFDEDHRSLRLSASADGRGLDLQLRVPRTDPEPVNGSGYSGYWLAPLEVDGTLTGDGENVVVRGHAMLDRLWGRVLPLGRGQLALSRHWLVKPDGAMLRCEQLRRRGGAGLPLTSCVLRDAHGAREQFDQAHAELAPLASGWLPVDRVTYPLRWQLRLPPFSDEHRWAPLGEVHRAPAIFPIDLASPILGEDGSWGLLELSNFRPPRHAIGD
jgi:predicted secreted hydrolase